MNLSDPRSLASKNFSRRPNMLGQLILTQVTIYLYIKSHRFKISSIVYQFAVFHVLRASASMTVISGSDNDPWFGRLGTRSTTTVISHSSCYRISRGIKGTPSGVLPSVRYNPRCSSIEGKSRDSDIRLMRELRVRSDQHPLCTKGRVNGSVHLFYYSGTYAYYRSWLRDVNHLKSEAADQQVSGLGYCKKQRFVTETRL